MLYLFNPDWFESFYVLGIYGYLYCSFLFTLHSLSWICLPYVHLVEYVFVEKGSFDMKKTYPLNVGRKKRLLSSNALAMRWMRIRMKTILIMKRS